MRTLPVPPAVAAPAPLPRPGTSLGPSRHLHPALPSEELAVGILVGSGVRISELSGLSLLAADGLSDLMLDSLSRGRAELRENLSLGQDGLHLYPQPVGSPRGTAPSACDTSPTAPPAQRAMVGGTGGEQARACLDELFAGRRWSRSILVMKVERPNTRRPWTLTNAPLDTVESPSWSQRAIGPFR